MVPPESVYFLRAIIIAVIEKTQKLLGRWWNAFMGVDGLIKASSPWLRMTLYGLLPFIAMPSHAAVYKCRGDGGIPMYQQTPCATGTELRNLEADPPTLSVVPPIAIPSAVPAAPSAAQPFQVRVPRAARERQDVHSGGDPRERRHLRAGMSDAEVMAKVGRPSMTSSGARKGTARWTYLPAGADADTITTVYLDRGVVMDVERRIVRRGQ